jgi:hypothetical protein
LVIICMDHQEDVQVPTDAERIHVSFYERIVCW